MKLHKISFVLLLIGGLNWGLYAFGWDLQMWLGLGDGVYKVVYILVGLSAVYELASHKKLCKMCEKKMM